MQCLLYLSGIRRDRQILTLNTLKEAKAYATELNGDKDKAVARCKELIVLRDSEAMVKFLDAEGKIAFEVVAAEMK